MKEATLKTQTQDALSQNLITKDEHETLTTFQSRIDAALLEGTDWVETSPAIIKYFNRSGIGKAEFFIYKNIKVCEQGQSERLQKGLDRPLGQILYGENEGKANQGTTTKPPGPIA